VILGIIPISFRFRGKLRRLTDIYFCFLENEGKALHPAQIARQTHIGLTEVSRRLDATPELFVRLPKRPDGLTRYRLTSATAAKEPDQISHFLNTEARKESLLLYAFGTMILLLLLIVAILVGPAL
jgi:hypothetical protein